MKLLRHDPAAGIPSTDPIFIGEVRVQRLVTDDDAELLQVTSVTFVDGARNRLHRHAADQVLMVTDGRGIVAAGDQELHVAAGDLVLVTAGEDHWHGAAPGHSMTHLSILTPGALTIVGE